MCGIIGYTGGNGDAESVLKQGLKSLEYRGYDSCGIALTTDSNIEINKAIGCTKNLSLSNLGSSCGIGHNRWATHGKVNLENAHPHSSLNQQVVLVHNGVIENSEEIKDFLVNKNYTFQGETDSEILVNLIEYYYRRDLTPTKAIKLAIDDVVGTFGLAILFRDKPETIYGLRRSSPLVLGVGENEHFLASDANALPYQIDKVVYLDDGQLVILNKKKFAIKNLSSDKDLEGLSKIKKIKKRKNDTELGEYSCFMEKEIHSQPSSIRDSITGRFNEDFSCIKFGGINLNKINRVVFLGCGTAYYAGLLGKYYMENIAGIPASVEFSSEYKYKNNPTEQGTLVVALSQSGETIDTLEAIKEAQNKNLQAIAITNVVSSSIARQVEEGIYQRIGPEISVASTKAFTSKATLLLMLAVQLGRHHNISPLESIGYIKQIRRIPELVEQTLEHRDEIRELAAKLQLYDVMDFLGRQYMYPIALEGALKLKEITYMDSHAYASGEIKHGPLALVRDGRAIFFLASQASLKDKNISNMKEIAARGADTYLVKQKSQEFPEDTYSEALNIPNCPDYISPILSVIPLQLFSMYTAQFKGKNVDRPRNLAKSVTVE